MSDALNLQDDIDRRKQRAPVTVICEQFGVDRRVVWRAARAQGVPLRNSYK